MILNHNVIIQDQAISADGLTNFDLGVNPLSMLLLRLRPLNNTGTLTDYQQWLGLCAAINLFTIRHRGNSIIAMRGVELAALAVMRHGYQPWLANPADTNNERVEALLPVFLGRGPYDHKSCFPETRRGEFEVEIDFDIADTGYDGLRFAAEAVEILGASPSEFERKVQLVQTFAATGINDIDLPLGNRIRGCQLFGTTAAGGTSPAPSFGRMQVIADGVGVVYSGADFETVYAMNGLRTAVPVGDHIHTEADTGGPTHTAAHVGEGYENHAYLDFDPTMNDQFSINSSQVSRLQLRCDAETGDLVRVVPIEVMSPSQL